MGDTVVDTTVATGDTVDTVARGRLRPRLLLLPSPRLMLRPIVDTMVDTTAATGDTVDTVYTVARGRLMPRPTVDMVDTMVDTGATVDTVDTVDTEERGRLMLRPTAAMVDTMVDTGATVDTVDTTADKSIL